MYMKFTSVTFIYAEDLEAGKHSMNTVGPLLKGKNMNKPSLLCNRDAEEAYEVPRRRWKHRFIVIISEIVVIIMQLCFSDNFIFLSHDPPAPQGRALAWTHAAG